VVRLAVFAAQLGLETGQEKIALGTYAMNRPPGDAQSMFGFFSNPITLILPFDSKLRFRRWLARVREVVIQTKARSEIPYDRLCEELHRGGTPPPEITAMFHRRTRWPPLERAGIEVHPPAYTTLGMPWGFNFAAVATSENEAWGAKFDPRIHDPDEVQGFIERCATLARRVVARPNRRLRRLGP
jgi:Condensation domain